jgi:rhamnosyltransferase
MLGLVGPHNDYLTNPQYWGANRDTVARLMRPVLPADDSAFSLGFFAGSMFWFKPPAIHQCATLVDLAGLGFEPENGKQDGTLAHAIERVFCNLARVNKYSATSNKMNGADIQTLPTDQHHIPVIKHQEMQPTTRANALSQRF